jgi:sodium/proline symporter
MSRSRRTPVQGGIFDLYEIAPGFILCAIAVIMLSRPGPQPAGLVAEDFDRTHEAERTGPITKPAE